MREIKFRGKRIDNGEWVFGSLIQAPNDLYHKVFIVVDASVRYDTTYVGNDDSVRVSSVMFAVDPKTVGQLTGLHDKNRREIYDGDIIRYTVYDRTEVLSVFLNKGCFKTKISNLFAVHAICEVIGNIYPNPELLKGSDDNGKS